MTKIYYNQNEINGLISSNFENSVNNLQKAISISNQLDIPSDFEYKKYLKNLDDKLQEDLDKMKLISNKIYKSSKLFSETSNELSSNLYDIEDYSILLRESAIK